MTSPPNVICAQCGSVNPATNRFCRTCRTVIETAPVQQPVYAVPVYAPVQPRPGFDCPFCHTNIPPFRQSKISSAGWAILIIMIFVCFPLFWIGFLITEEQSICSQCGIKLG